MVILLNMRKFCYENNELTLKLQLYNNLRVLIKPQNIYGDRLNKFDELLEIGSKYQFTKSIKDTKDDLEKKLFGLEEGGATALGPALVVAEGMCAKSPGAKIVICTDGNSTDSSILLMVTCLLGLSNVGLGSLDSLVTDEEKDAVAKFYEQIGMICMSEFCSSVVHEFYLNKILS
jgi:hypothetical protein